MYSMFIGTKTFNYTNKNVSFVKNLTDWKFNVITDIAICYFILNKVSGDM